MNGGYKVLLQFTYHPLSLCPPLFTSSPSSLRSGHENIFFICSYLFYSLLSNIPRTAHHRTAFVFCSLLSLYPIRLKFSRILQSWNSKRQSTDWWCQYQLCQSSIAHTQRKRQISLYPGKCLGACGNIIISCCSSITLVMYDCANASPFRSSKILLIH